MKALAFWAVAFCFAKQAGSVLLLFSGIENHVSADEYAPFEANRNFFYLTGLRRDHMILLMDNAGETPKTTLFIEEADPTQERWYGRKVTVEEAKEITQITDIRFIDSFESAVDYLMTREDVTTVIRWKICRITMRYGQRSLQNNIRALPSVICFQLWQRCVCRKMRMKSQ